MINGVSKAESNSIGSQRELIRSFLNEQEDMELYDIYVDDGFSGSNFDRPEFNRMMKDIEAGKQGVVSDNKVFESFKAQALTKNSGTGITDLIELEQYLKASMFNEIGLNANYNMKRERLSESEVEMNGDNLYPLVDDMASNRKSAIERINNLFGTDIQVEFNSSWDYRIYQGLSIHNTGDEITPEQMSEQLPDETTSQPDVESPVENVETIEVEKQDEQEEGKENEPENS